MKNNTKIGIVGMGYVGSAIFNGFKDFFKVNSYDIKKPSTCNSLDELVDISDVLFICLPTPMNKKGECDLTLIDSVLAEINSIAENQIIVIKSTCIPGSCSIFQKKFSNLKIVFNPEFLREKYINEDFMNQKFIILGGNQDYTNQVKDLYFNIFPDIKYFLTDSSTAEMAKYTINTFLALKVSFANEIYDICNAKNIDYDEMINMVIQDDRIGNSHLSVPGEDSKRGYGGSCFPKDVSALYYETINLNLVSYIIKASYDRNRDIDRPERDWENLVGRAVSDN